MRPRLLRSSSGAAVVEFALVAPLLMLMILALVDFGLAVLERTRLNSAARAGAQVAMTSPSNTSAIEAAVLAATGADSSVLKVTVASACECSDGTSVSCTGSCATGSVRTYVTITVTESFALMLNYPGFTNPISLSGQAVVRGAS